MKKFTLLIVLLIIGLNSYSQLSYRIVATNLNTPWEIKWGSDDHIWVTERPGIVSRIDPSNGNKKIILDIQSNVMTGGERGLMGMAMTDPIIGSPEVFVAYTYNTSISTRVQVVRYIYDPINDTLDSPDTIISNVEGNNNHNGCRLWVDGSYIYMTTGDAEASHNAQNSNQVNGKILRLFHDGTFPPGNPFHNGVWSKGHRNPQGLVMANGKLYSAEHGPDSDDEINIIEEGHNYGWPNVEGFCNTPDEITFCNDSNVTEPIFAWTPTLAVAGLDYYDDDLIPDFENSLLVVSLKAGRLIQLKLNASGDSILDDNVIINNTYGRLRDLCISPDGRIFVSTSNRDGRGAPAGTDDRIIEISPAGSGFQNISANNVKIYPNPSKTGQSINVDFNAKVSGYYTITDMSGKMIDQQAFTNALSENINTEGMNAGFYFLKLITDKFTATKKMVIN